MKEIDKVNVLSVPAGSSYPLVVRYHIHSCPDTYKYRPTKYITFRQKGGVMDALFEIEHIFSLRPKNKEELEKMELMVRHRVISYIEDEDQHIDFGESLWRFYILSPEKRIDLRHKPQMRKNVFGHCYFTDEELLSGRRIVYVASRFAD